MRQRLESLKGDSLAAYKYALTAPRAEHPEKKPGALTAEDHYGDGSWRCNLDARPPRLTTSDECSRFALRRARQLEQERQRHLSECRAAEHEQVRGALNDMYGKLEERIAAAEAERSKLQRAKHRLREHIKAIERTCCLALYCLNDHETDGEEPEAGSASDEEAVKDAAAGRD